MPFVRQADFTGGEIDPRLYGKTTAQKAPTFVRKLSNFIVGPQGAAMNRPGTKFVALAKDQSAPPRFIRFDWPSQNYLLEVSAGNIRVYANGVFVVDVAAAALTAAMLPYLKYAQKDDVLVICYGGQTADAAIVPQQLRRVSHAVWTFGPVGFTPPLNAYAFWLTDSTGSDTTNPAGVPDPAHVAIQWDYAFTLTLRTIATGEVVETSIVSKFSDGTSPNPATYNAATAYVAGAVAVYGGRLYTAKVGSTGSRPDISPTQWDAGIVVYADSPLYISTFLSPGFVGSLTGYEVLAINVYRGKSGVFGLVGSTSTNWGSFFTDTGDTPDYALQPPQGTDPFAIYNAGHAVTGHDYPACVTHFQQRRIFARQLAHLGRVQGSKPGQLSNFDVTDIVQDSDAINFDLSSQAIEDIRSLISARALIVLTSTGATVIRGAGSQRGGSTAITPASVDATKQGTRGASWVDPVMVDNTILFAGSKAAEVRALTYDPYWEVLGTPGADIGLVAQHFLRGHAIVDMSYQSAPNSIVWLVRDDGLLLGLTFVPAQQPDDAVHGWHQHPTNGNVQRVCVVQEGLEDVVYLVVQRAGAFNIERLADRTLPVITIPDPQDATKTITQDDVRMAVFLDASLTFDGRNKGLVTMQFVSDAGTYGGGEEGVITASSASFVGASDEGDFIIFDPDGLTGGPFGFTILSYTDPTHVRAILNGPLPAGFQIATQSWAWARDTMTGLGHLEARDVMVLADGAVQGPFTVAGGAITLSAAAVIATAGLAYVSDLELLDVIPDQVRTNVKAIPRVFLEVVASRGILIGEDDSSLRPWRGRDKPDIYGNPPLVTDQIEIRISSSWNRGGRALIRQTDPLPLIVTAASREIVVGGV